MSFDDKHALIAHDRRKDLMNLISPNTSIQIVELALVLAEKLLYNTVYYTAIKFK